MVLQASGQIQMNQLYGEFAGITSPNPTTYATDSSLYNLNYYRGKDYWNGGGYVLFPSGTISFASFFSTAGNCPSNCDCASCFLVGSLVNMADGTTKTIETVQPGDYVVGAFGETNKVLGLDWVILGNRLMYEINNEHSTSSEHPHVSLDKKFYCAKPDLIAAEWGGLYPVILENGTIVRLLNRGISLQRINVLETGIKLRTFEGSKTVETIRQYKMPYYTKLYNLVVGGSHTYFVDQYAVTGWPREDDFDYDNWKPKGRTLTIDDYYY